MGLCCTLTVHVLVHQSNTPAIPTSNAIATSSGPLPPASALLDALATALVRPDGEAVRAPVPPSCGLAAVVVLSTVDPTLALLEEVPVLYD